MVSILRGVVPSWVQVQALSHLMLDLEGPHEYCTWLDGEYFIYYSSYSEPFNVWPIYHPQLSIYLGEGCSEYLKG